MMMMETGGKIEDGKLRSWILVLIVSVSGCVFVGPWPRPGS